jgi:hypothetical protein
MKLRLKSNSCPEREVLCGATMERSAFAIGLGVANVADAGSAGADRRLRYT